MKKLLFTWPLLAVLVACNQNLGEGIVSAKGSEDFVINGDIVKFGQTQASRSVVVVELLDQKGKFVSLCTGTLISANKVITAGHCFDTNLVKNFANFNIVFTTDYFDSSPKVRREGKVHLKHPQYYMVNEGTYPAIPHDMAIAVFKGDLPAGYVPAAVDSDVNADYSKDILYIYAYGRRIPYTGEVGENPLVTIGTLRKGELKASLYKEFKDQYRLTPEMKNAICSGDSGGPQFYNKGDVLKIVGITGSANIGRLKNGYANCGKSGFATKVAPAFSWIQSVLKLR